MLIKKTCSKCGGINDRRHIGKRGQRYCKSCHAENMRENRPAYSELSPLQKLKANCRSYAREYLKRGLLIKRPCEKCGSKKVEMHHKDYTKPLEVNWLCRKDHLELHAQETAQC